MLNSFMVKFYNKNILFCAVILLILLCFNSCSKDIKKNSKEITIKLSTPECDPLISLDSNGYYYYKCSFLDSKNGSFKVDISNNNKEIDAIFNMDFKDWDSLSLCSNYDCKGDSKNVFIVHIKENNKVKSYTIDGQNNCNAKCKFLDELHLIFIRYGNAW